MKYVGVWNNRGTVVVVRDDGREDPLPPRTDLMNHSPSGFAWGYGGSGPAQLALAILYNHLDNASAERIDELRRRAGFEDPEEAPPTIEELTWREWLAIRLHQHFKSAVIARLPFEDNFTITDQQVGEAIEKIIKGE